MENTKREDHSKKGSLVHDSEAVQLQGRGRHPRGRAKGSGRRAHIEQSPLKAQRSAFQGFPCIQSAAAAAAAPTVLSDSQR